MVTQKVVALRRVATPRVREQTIVQIAPYFMITHVQTALRKAGNYDKTGRTRKKHARRALFVYTAREGVQEVCGGEKTRGSWVIANNFA